jgi:hypothetical protein
MKLSQLFKESELPEINFDDYLNPNKPFQMPSLDTRALLLEALAGKDRSIIKTPFNGTGTLLVRYKDKEGGLLSIDEQEDGETWDITQVQGGKSRKSYRVATCLNWHLLLGKRTEEYALHPESEVRQITMIPPSCMENIDGARSERVHRGYNTIKGILGMQWSEEMKLFVADIRKKCFS